MKVPFFRYPHVFTQYEGELKKTLLRVAASGGYIMQEDLRDFEDHLAEYCGVGHAVGVGNATDAIELNLEAVGIGPGDEVILPGHTFVASAGAVKAVEAEPVFAEIAADHLMDPDDVEHRVTERTRALMPTQLNGRTAEMDRFREIADRNGLILLEDSAQGLGSLYKGRMAGTFGIGGVFSFYPAKTLGALGDAGAVITDDADHAAVIRELRDHGRNPETGEVMRWGRNSRMDNLQAAVLLVKLRHLDDEIARRRELAGLYHEGLADVDEVVLPPPPQDSGSDHYDVFQNYEVEAERRGEIRAYLADRDIGTILQWGGKAVHEFGGLGVDQSLPRTESIMRRSFLLPMNTSLTDDEVAYVCEQIRGFYRG